MLPLGTPPTLPAGPHQTLRRTAQQTPTTATVSSDPLASGKDLHSTVPPEKWCITRKDLKHLLQEVRKAMREGGIPEDPNQPNPGHYSSKIGPSVYSVVEHVLKPMTFRAGGMSYALMRNPQGLACDIFVSHAWAEGIFEFAYKVMRGWPRFLPNLWCCALALPQNLSITELLRVPLPDTPFARALHAAEMVIVVPNRSVSIYSRLWCVFEAHLATQANKDMVVPDTPSSTKWIKAICGWVLLPAIAGWLLGAYLQYRTFHDGLSIDEGSTIDSAARAATSATLIKLFFSLGCRETCGMHVPLCAAFSVLLTIAHSVIDAYWIRLYVDGLVVFYLFPRLFLFLIVITRFLLPIWETNRWLQDRQVESQSRQLGVNFDDVVANARCSDEQDEQRIRSYIAGSEDDVDHSITMLTKAGAYSSILQRADSLGLNARHWGHTHVCSLYVGGTVLWTLALFVCANDLWLGENHIDRWPLEPPLALGMTASLVVGTSVLLPILASLCKWNRTRLIVASRLWFFSSVSATVVTLLGLGVPHIVVESNRNHFLERPMYLAYRTPFLIWPGACALMSFVLILVGYNRLLCWLEHTRNFCLCRKTLRWKCEASGLGDTDEDIEESVSTTQSSESGSEELSVGSASTSRSGH